MKKLSTLQIILIALAVLAIFYILYSIFSGKGSETSNESSRSLTSSSEDQYAQTYSDETYHFSFKYPEGFTVTVVPLAVSEVEPSVGKGGGETILVESSDKKIGIQMLISPYGSDVDITEAMIRSDIPNMKVSDVQTVEIGPNRKGLAFMSDNSAFGGASREVWFVFNGNLYQISTYAEFDELLKGLFGTWTFL